jgi:hypothetical protein
MPYGDGTGPRGFGPVTGHGAGHCAGNTVPDRANFGPVWACRRGGGWGWRNRYYETGLTGWQRGGGWGNVEIPVTAPMVPAGVPTPMNRELQLSILKTQADSLTRTLDAIKKQIETLDAQNEKDME